MHRDHASGWSILWPAGTGCVQEGRDFLVNPVLRFAATGVACASTPGRIAGATKIFSTRC
jgi:hypothetical protein